VVSSRSRLRRTVWYTALALSSAAFLLFPKASPAWSATPNTPLVVSYTIDGISGTNNWFRGSTHGNNIVLHWTVTPASDVVSSQGCDPAIQIPGPNTGTTRTCTATNTLGETTTVTTRLLKIDADPPTTLASRNRPPNAAGWYRAPVAISWSGSDATSGLASCTGALNYSGPDTTGTTETGICTDNAGNSSSAGAVVKYDSTPPLTAGTPSRAPNAAGWYRAPLSIGWTGSDATSGLAACSAALSYNGPDTTGTSEVGACTDNAGNSSAGAFVVRYDTVAPRTIATPSRAPNSAGWFRAPVSIGWTGNDATSGIAACSSSVTYKGPDTTGTTEPGTCTDKAGNSSSGSYVVKYDTTPPAFRALALTALDGRVRLRWKVSGAAGVRLTRSPGMKRAASSELYSGNGDRFADTRVENYVRYRYTLTTTDVAGNTASRSVSAVPLPVLYAPRPGARLSRPDSLLFAWRATRKADYYNLQLWRGGHKVGSWWPSSPRLRVPSRWHSGGKTRRLTPGAYTWYVWPGRGARRLGKYGPLLGTSTFAVR